MFTLTERVVSLICPTEDPSGLYVALIVKGVWHPLFRLFYWLAQMRLWYEMWWQWHSWCETYTNVMKKHSKVRKTPDEKWEFCVLVFKKMFFYLKSESMREPQINYLTLKLMLGNGSRRPPGVKFIDHNKAVMWAFSGLFKFIRGL